MKTNRDLLLSSLQVRRDEGKEAVRYFVEAGDDPPAHPLGIGLAHSCDLEQAVLKI